MKVDSLGESAWILRDLPKPAYECADLIRKNLPEVIEVVPAYETVALYFKDEPPLFDQLILAIGQKSNALQPKNHRIPVCYELGEDLEEVCEALSLDQEGFIGYHTQRSYDCFAVGFCPGFPYLGYLPEGIAGLPRRPSPRVRVPPGSVAITGAQTGIYPLERPGGWRLVGRTPLQIVHVEDRYFPIQAGDKVMFYDIGKEQFAAMQGERL